MLRNTNYSEPISRVPGDVINRQWFYQTCTEFGWFQSSNQPNRTFGSSFPVSFFVKMCSDVFGQNFNLDLLERGVDLKNLEYGVLNTSVSNVVFVHGSLDPLHVLGITKDALGKSTAILIEGMSHGSDLFYEESKYDPDILKKARKKISNFIGAWIKILL